MCVAITYGLILVLPYLYQRFLAWPLTPGATTGTFPFVLALSLGLPISRVVRLRGNSFGLVGIMSAGPILAVILSIISRQRIYS